MNKRRWTLGTVLVVAMVLEGIVLAGADEYSASLTYDFNHDLEGWEALTTTPKDPLFPTWQESYGGRLGVVKLSSCTYPAHDRRAGGATLSILRKTITLPVGILTLNIVAAKKVGGWPESGYSDGLLRINVDHQQLALLYLRALKDATPRWHTFTLDFSPWAGQTVTLEIVGVPGGDGRACPTCTGTCDNEDIMIDAVIIRVEESVSEPPLM